MSPSGSGVVTYVSRAGQVVVYSDPGPSGYGSHQVLMPGHTIPVVIDGIEVGQIPVDDVLP